MIYRSTLALRPASRLVISRKPVSVRSWTSIKDDHQYNVKATSYGSRADGRSKLDDGKLELKMDLPAALGGSGKNHNPEELFAMAYSTCFLSAMGAVYKEKFGTVTGKPFSKDVKVHAEVVIGNATDAPGFKLAARLQVPYDSLASTKISKSDAEALIKGAHEICPYSRAIKGNVETEVTLV